MRRVERGAIYRTEPVGRDFVVLSIRALNDSGTAIVCEVTGTSYSGPRNMLTVPLDAEHGDTRPGAYVLAWRINYVRTERLGTYIGDVSPTTLERVITAVNAAIEP